MEGGDYMNTVDKVLSIAEAEVGYLEKKDGNLNYLYDKTANAGSNNYTKYNKEMHDIYPAVMDYPAYWCDAFVDWCFYKAYGVANAKGLLGGNFDDYTIQSAQLYKNKGAYYTTLKVGDQIFFNNGVRICHTGIVYAVDSSRVYTIEGNTSGGSTVVANGGGVAKKSYLLSYNRIDGYGRPNYDEGVSEQSKEEYTQPKEVCIQKGDTGSTVTKIQKMFISIGYTSIGEADGIAGSKFVKTVKQFQEDKCITVDGKVGVETLAALQKEYNKDKYKVTKDCYLRSEPKIGNATKIKYSKVKDIVKSKCTKDDDGYALFKKDSVFKKVATKKDTDDNKWVQMKSGYWIPAVYDRERRIAKI